MEQRVSIFTIRTEDLEEATRFYTEGLGWEPFLSVPGEVTFIQVAPGVAMSFFDARGFDTDAGRRLPFWFTFSHNVESEQEVRDVVATMVDAGGTILNEPRPATWGGYHAHVADPQGLCWEIAHNPSWSVAADGTVRIGGVAG